MGLKSYSLDIKKMAYATFFALCMFVCPIFINFPCKSYGAETPIFYPPLPETPRIQFLTTINGSNFVNANNSPYGNRFPGYTDTASLPESNPIERPFGMATTKGKLYVCDTERRQVLIFDFIQNTTDVIKGLKLPLGIAVDGEGNSYVSDGATNKIMVFNRNNQPLTSFQQKNVKPIGLLLDDNKLYFSDMSQNQIVVLDRNTGRELSRISAPGSTPGKIFAPTGIAFDTQKNIYVADTFNARISKFKLSGEFIDTLGQIGTAIGSFARPKGLAIDRSNRVYVVDNSFENIQIFDEKKQLLLFFGEAGNTRGGLNLPVQIILDYNNVEYFKKFADKGHELEYLIFVSNGSGLNKINVYGFLKQ